MKVHLDVRALLLVPKGQSAQKVEESADLLGCEVVHVVQDSLHQISCSVKNSSNHNGKILNLCMYTVRDCKLLVHTSSNLIYTCFFSVV